MSNHDLFALYDDLKSENGENREYDRGVLEALARVSGYSFDEFAEAVGFDLHEGSTP